MPTVEAGGVRLGYENQGSGWPLVFVHGGWLDRELWQPQLEHFGRDLRAVAVDCRDHGESERVDASYGIDALAEDLAALLDELGLARPVVCGLSMGGLVAQQFAARHPDRLSGLVLAGTVTSFPPVPLSGFQKRLLLPRAGYHAAARSMGAGAYFRMLLAGVESMEGRWLARTDAAREYALAEVDAFAVDPFLRVMDALYEFEAPALPDVPALVVHGDHEASSVVRQSEALADRLDADRTVVPEAAHLANRDNPEGFNQALGGFLDEHVTLPA